jgi:2-polyprenyl-3-methyl-5-hydroxy-6-metoxy-1,4-benzoquinol methylase
MTKYLKQELNCQVDAIDVDEAAGSVAANWAHRSFAGDLDDLNLWTELPPDCNNYDYIILADVLEHLRKPADVLLAAKKLLKKNSLSHEGGSLWISIPNTAHNAVLIDLLNDKFIYRQVGLLDETHIKLFTINSLLEMIQDTGLTVKSRIDLPLAVEHTEFNNSYSDLPPEVTSFLQQRELGEIYQFVMELKDL